MARFLNDNDYKKQIQAVIKNIISQNDPLILEDSEIAAQGEMETYLNGRYKIQAIFDTDLEPKQRNALIVMYLVDITLYHLFSTISPDLIPALREKRYKAALDWLKDVSKGNISPILPLRDIDAVDTVPALAHGGNQKYNNPDSRF